MEMRFPLLSQIECYLHNAVNRLTVAFHVSRLSISRSNFAKPDTSHFAASSVIELKLKGGKDCLSHALTETPQCRAFAYMRSPR